MEFKQNFTQKKKKQQQLETIYIQLEEMYQGKLEQ